MLLLFQHGIEVARRRRQTQCTATLRQVEIVLDQVVFGFIDLFVVLVNLIETIVLLAMSHCIHGSRKDVTEMNQQASCRFSTESIDFTLAVSVVVVVVIPFLSKCRSC